MTEDIARWPLSEYTVTMVHIAYQEEEKEEKKKSYEGK